MHQLKIVHRDIKEGNIGWSPSLKRWVFLDFGFSKNIQEDIGEKSETKFIGTLGYTIDELKSLFYLNSKGFIDFYFNDLVGLETTLSIIGDRINQKRKKKEEK